MTKNQKKAVAFLRENPNATSADVAQHLGIHGVSAYNLLRPLVDQGLVSRHLDTSQWDAKPTYKLIRIPRDIDHVLAWSQEIGHPFGILAAQVMA